MYGEGFTWSDAGSHVYEIGLALMFLVFWYQNFQSKRSEKAANDRIDKNVTELGHVKHQRELDKVEINGQLTGIEKTQDRLIKLLQDENKELRDRYDEAVRRHNEEVVTLRSEVQALRTELAKALENSSRRQEDYDKSRVEIHTLRNELNDTKLKNELMKVEKAALQTELTGLKQAAKLTAGC